MHYSGQIVTLFMVCFVNYSKRKIYRTVIVLIDKNIYTYRQSEKLMITTACVESSVSSFRILMIMRKGYFELLATLDVVFPFSVFP